MPKRVLNHRGQPVDSKGRPIVKNPKIHVPGNPERKGMVLVDARGRPLNKKEIIVPTARELEKLMPDFREIAKKDPLLEDARNILAKMQKARRGMDVLGLMMQSRLFKHSLLGGKLNKAKVRVPGKGLVALEKAGLMELGGFSARDAKRLFSDLIIYEYERKKAEWNADKERMKRSLPESRIIKP